MIDIENEVFTTVAKALRDKHKGIVVYGDETKRIVPSFPAATIVEEDNSAYTPSMTSPAKENHASLMYKVDVYSNKETGKKAECKAIMSTINDVMTGMGFVRTLCQPVANIQNISIYRMTAQFTGVAGKDKYIYRS